MPSESTRIWSGLRFHTAWRIGAVGLAVVGAWALLASPAARAYTPEQVTAGQQVYVAHCAGCHGDRGQGAGPEDPEAPLLIGARALTGFSDGQDLYQFVFDSMPQDKAGSLTPDEYWNVLAWLLAQNNIGGPGAALGPATAAGVSLRR